MSAKRTILIVEDDEAFRYATSRFLQDKGYSVVDVPSSMKALQEANRSPFDLAIIDVTLYPNEPHGIAFARMIRHRYPGTLILFVTAMRDVGQLDPTVPGEVLLKPVTLDDVLCKVRKLLA